MSSPEHGQPLHILVLADRDWKHNDTGGNGANIWAQVSRWVAAGNRVTVVAGEYPGCQRLERMGDHAAKMCQNVVELKGDTVPKAVIDKAATGIVAASACVRHSGGP